MNSPFDDAPKEIKRIAVFLDKFYKESDRGAALMASSIMEEVLSEIILSFLVDEKESLKLLDGFNAPLGTFSARILISYSLGLLEKREYVEIEAIRKIRNLFGHSWNNIDFNSEEIVAHLSRFPFKEEIPRGTFNNMVANLLGELMWRTHYVKEARLVPQKWPNKSGFLKRSE